jgi:hypothetical protein
MTNGQQDEPDPIRTIIRRRFAVLDRERRIVGEHTIHALEEHQPTQLPAQLADITALGDVEVLGRRLTPEGALDPDTPIP